MKEDELRFLFTSFFPRSRRHGRTPAVVAKGLLFYFLCLVDSVVENPPLCQALYSVDFVPSSSFFWLWCGEHRRAEAHLFFSPSSAKVEASLPLQIGFFDSFLFFSSGRSEWIVQMGGGGAGVFLFLPPIPHWRKAYGVFLFFFLPFFSPVC